MMRRGREPNQRGGTGSDVRTRRLKKTFSSTAGWIVKCIRCFTRRFFHLFAVVFHEQANDGFPIGITTFIGQLTEQVILHDFWPDV